jgi:hypothetical protein
LDTKLNAVRTRRKAAEGIRKNPQWDEGSDEKHEDAEGRVSSTAGVEKMRGDVHDSETTTYVLADQAGDNSSSIYAHEFKNRVAKRREDTL